MASFAPTSPSAFSDSSSSASSSIASAALLREVDTSSAWAAAMADSALPLSADDDVDLLLAGDAPSDTNLMAVLFQLVESEEQQDDFAFCSPPPLPLPPPTPATTTTATPSPLVLSTPAAFVGTRRMTPTSPPALVVGRRRSKPKRRREEDEEETATQQKQQQQQSMYSLDCHELAAPLKRTRRPQQAQAQPNKRPDYTMCSAVCNRGHYGRDWTTWACGAASHRPMPHQLVKLGPGVTTIPRVCNSHYRWYRRHFLPGADGAKHAKEHKKCRASGPVDKCIRLLQLQEKRWQELGMDCTFVSYTPVGATPAAAAKYNQLNLKQATTTATAVSSKHAATMNDFDYNAAAAAINDDDDGFDDALAVILPVACAHNDHA